MIGAPCVKGMRPTTDAIRAPRPHDGLQPSMKKSTCPLKMDSQDISDTTLVTLYTDFRGLERSVVLRVEPAPQGKYRIEYRFHEVLLGGVGVLIEVVGI